MECETARPELVAWLQGELDEETARAVEEHVAGCRDCAAECSGTARLLEQTGSILPVFEYMALAADGHGIVRMAPARNEEALRERLQARGLQVRAVRKVPPAEPEAWESHAMARVANAIIANAIRDGASDIHVRRAPGGPTEVLYRIDGVLQPIMVLPAHLHAAALNRLKVMADLDIAESRVPQRGRIGIALDGAAYDLRVATFPFPQGERATLRILRPEVATVDWDQIGISEREAKRLRRVLASASGLVLVAGPSGCGKTTTLYSLVHALDREQRNVVSVEDPVEYPMEGVTQVPVIRKVGVTAAAAVRALADAGADVLVVGELRTAEETRAVLEAAQAGKLVLSTLFADDALGAVGRLSNLGMPPLLLANGLLAVVSVRLARKVCPRCRQEVALSPQEAAGLGLPGGARVARGSGCEECRMTGYRGRIQLFEVLVADGGVQRTIAAGAPGQELAQAARGAGMRPMRDAAAEKVLAGITSAFEALRVLPREVGDGTN